jgi:hypothetical protein
MKYDFKNIAITLYESDSGGGYKWSGEEGYRIIVSEKDIDSAKLLVEKMLKWNSSRW